MEYRSFKDLRESIGHTQDDARKAMGYKTRQAVFYVEAGNKQSPRFTKAAMLYFKMNNLPVIRYDSVRKTFILSGVEVTATTEERVKANA